MQHLEVSATVRPLKWSLGVKWLTYLEPLGPPRPLMGDLYLIYYSAVFVGTV